MLSCQPEKLQFYQQKTDFDHFCDSHVDTIMILVLGHFGRQTVT